MQPGASGLQRTAFSARGRSAPRAKLVSAMSTDSRRQLPGGLALWVAATGFWLLVTALSAAQVVWLAQTPGQQMDLRSALIWNISYFIPWIPVTVAVWRITRGWLPERFGGWFLLCLPTRRSPPEQRSDTRSLRRCSRGPSRANRRHYGTRS